MDAEDILFTKTWELLICSRRLRVLVEDESSQEYMLHAAFLSDQRMSKIILEYLLMLLDDEMPSDRRDCSSPSYQWTLKTSFC